MRRAALVLALLLTTACGGGEEEPRTPPAEPPREIEVDASSTLYGFVGDTAGNPVEGVVVSDGFQCVATDAGGVYEMKRDAAAEYVCYSVPAEFKIRTGHDGYPDFYVRLDTSQQKIRQDFTLERLAGVERNFRLICIGDPQPAKAEEATRFEREAMVDVRRTATASAVPCYGVALGDITGEKPDLLAGVRRSLGTAGIPVFALPGNHDKYKVDDATPRDASYFRYTMGPVDYSFNRGDVHIVSMDNIIHECQESAGYTGGFSAEQYEWLKQDLSYVPKDKMVILCVHIPFRNSKYAYYDEVLELLSQYKYATIMSAHTHSNINHIHTKNGKEIFEHVTGTSCGAWWRSTVCTEGTPIGFGIYRIEGAAMKEWNYKSVQHGEDFQIRLYRGSDKFTGGGDASYYFSKKNAGQIVANIWNWDPAWTVNVYENGAKTGTMTQYSDKDAWTVAYHIGILNNSSSYNKATDHMFYYTLTNPDADVKVEAIDRFGNKYEQTVFTDPDSHPGIYHLDY